MDSMNSTTSASHRSWPSISAFLQFWLRENPLQSPERQVFEKYYSGYRQRFGPYMQHHFSEQTREITEAIGKSTSPRLLEVGAGCGTESLWFSILGAHVTAIDLAEDRLGVARARKAWLQENSDLGLHVEFKESSIFDFRPQQNFDLIWMEQTFHHLEPRERVYTKLFELLKPGGTLVISEANAWNLPLQLQLFLRRGFKTKTFFVDKNGNRIEYGNERITTPFALCAGLRSAGFEVAQVRSFRILPNLNPPSAWLAIEEKILKLLPFLSTHFNLVARKPLA